ncbi:FmdB family zinc ribbon protein [Corynebacterium tapiri]|nr:zinc ribbon domain-containing protein [Corynebacterium tapiri]
MPFYEFACPDGHRNERLMSMSAAEREIDCPDCGSRAQRVVSVIGSLPSQPGISAAMDNAARSAHEPAVVNSIPRAGNARPTPVSRNPLHSHLPKP